MKTKDQMQEEILRLCKDAGPGYGDNVLPAINLYCSITEYDERKAYSDAVEMMLTSEDKKIREYAVTLCLGFIAFRDVAEQGDGG